MVEEDASEFPVHLDGCKQLRQLPHFVTVPSHTNSQVQSICNVLTLLARTTSHNLEPVSWKSRENLSSGPLHFLSNDRSVEYIYGVTPILGNLLRNTCDIRQHLAFYEGGHIPPDLVTECETLRDELLTWHIDSESFCLIKSDEQTNLEIVRCQARAFHAAILIFYYRTIDNYKDPVIIQRRVRSIWINLTQAENLKEDCMGANKRTAPMSWPAFIASCEATDRQPWVEWWTRAQGYGIGNFRRQWQIIQQVWAILDVDENVTDWRDALRQTGKLILPI
jgi:arginine metabolism regulation protein II